MWDWIFTHGLEELIGIYAVVGIVACLCNLDFDDPNG